MARKLKSMDGNTAAAHVSYAYSDVAAIYPITPSSVMAELADKWATDGQKNIFGREVQVTEMQSEAGAAGAVHGSLVAGALTTTFTASQGLLLMIPNMYKMAGEHLPCVIDVSARAIATHALSIFGDQSDIYACRQTGFAILGACSVQEVMDLTPVAHCAAIKGRVPFINFFDGFRTSHEIQKIEVWDYEDLKDMIDMEAVENFKATSLNPNRACQMGSSQNPDTFFQVREASNKHYEALPAIVEEYFNKVNEKLGTNYSFFNYYGAPDAEHVIIAMGSVCETAEEVVDYLNEKEGGKYGIIKVRLYRPFCADKLIEVIPDSVKQISVLDKTKEPGSLGEPLYLDVVAALHTSKFKDIPIFTGRYGLGSKDTNAAQLVAAYKNTTKKEFTIGIEDDVTNLSLDCSHSPITADKDTYCCKFWGLGADGTVGANKNSIKIIGDNTDLYVQAYFDYDSKKSGGVTVSHLRFGDKPIKSPYYINKADFVACHNPSYVVKGFKMVNDVKPGGVFLINCQWSDEELEKHMPAEAKRYIAKNDIKLYTVNAIDLAVQVGMGKRTNTILQSAFFSLANVMPSDEAIQYMKDAATKSYSKKGQEIVDANHKAIDAGASAYHMVEVPASWAEAEDCVCESDTKGAEKLVKMVDSILTPVDLMNGDSLPVSAFVDHADGTFEQGASAYEKRGVAVLVPEWNADTCAKCNKCAYVCPHATIRPFAMNEEEVAAAPANMKKAPKPVVKTNYTYTLAVSPMDCMGCGVCIGVCPTNSLKMVSRESQEDQQAVFDYCVANVTEKEVASNATVISSQYKKPLLEFSGSCAGCAETSYARLITQLFGDRMYISNATGCSSIWGGPAATSPYTVNDKGHGPAWANSLFEDNAEHGLGMFYGQDAIRSRLIEDVKKIACGEKATDEVKAAAEAYLATVNDGEKNSAAADALVAELEKLDCDCEVRKDVLANKEYLSKKSVWIFGGDGWAYDIGFGGLDHVLASGRDVNVMVFDTEVYSNTGGQASKASNIGQVAQFAAAGKEIAKKSLAEIAMSYGYVYVAQIAMGADQNQTLKALKEAEAYNGPSLIIGYSPCEMHSIKGGMTNCQAEMKKAVDCGYWNLFRYNPALKAEGKNPFTMDSKEPTGEYRAFLMNEARYNRLCREFADRADSLFTRNEEASKARYAHLLKLKDLYAPED